MCSINVHPVTVTLYARYTWERVSNSSPKYLPWLITASFLPGQGSHLAASPAGFSVIQRESIVSSAIYFFSIMPFGLPQVSQGGALPRTDPSFTKTLGKTQASRLRGLTEKMKTLTAWPALCRTERDPVRDAIQGRLFLPPQGTEEAQGGGMGV